MPEDVQPEATPVAEDSAPDFAAIDAAFTEAYGEGGEATAEEILKGPDDTINGSETEQDRTEPEVTGEEESQKDSPEADQSDAPPQVDPSLVALAVQQGADKAALDKLVTEDPEEANQLLTQLAEEVNRVTLQSLQGQTGPTGQDGQSTQSATSSDDQEITPLEAMFANEETLAEAREEFGEKHVELLRPLAEQAKQNREDRAFTAQLRQELEVQKEQAMIAQLNDTFKSFGVGYTEFYGADIAKVSEAQQANRESVTQIADKLRVADILTNKPERPLRNYLTEAHAIVSVDQQRTAARRELLSKIETRSKSTTAKPNRSKSSGTSTPEENASIELGKKAAQLGLEGWFGD
jgi:hypothetical protein